MPLPREYIPSRKLDAITKTWTGMVEHHGYQRFVLSITSQQPPLAIHVEPTDGSSAVMQLFVSRDSSEPKDGDCDFSCKDETDCTLLVLGSDYVPGNYHIAVFGQNSGGFKLTVSTGTSSCMSALVLPLTCFLGMVAFRRVEQWLPLE